MRKRGASIREIESKLGIPRSTLSLWLSRIPISEQVKKSLKRRADQALFKARVEAVKWHNAQKATRIAQAQKDAARSLAKIDINQSEIIELALAMLYLGEGSKKNAQTSMGNSNPLILRFFVQSIQRLYNLSPSDFTCHLHLRADQDADRLTRYWSRVLAIPRRNFWKPVVDLRTTGSRSYPEYKGVCAVSCSRVAIQRKLLYIANAFAENASENRAVSSIGRALR